MSPTVETLRFAKPWTCQIDKPLSGLGLSKPAPLSVGVQLGGVQWSGVDYTTVEWEYS